MDRISRDILDRIAAELKLPPGDPRVLQLAYKLLWELATGQDAARAERAPNPMLPASDDPALRAPDHQDLTDLVDSILEDPRPRTEFLARPIAAEAPDASTALRLKELLEGVKGAPPESLKRKSAREWVPAPAPAPAPAPTSPEEPAPAIGMEVAPKLSTASPWSVAPGRSLTGAALTVRGARYAPRGARLGRGSLELSPESAARHAPPWLIALAVHLLLGVVFMNIVYFTAYTKPAQVFRIGLQPSKPLPPPPLPPAGGSGDHTVPGTAGEDSPPAGPVDPRDPRPAGTKLPEMPEVSDTTPSVGIGTTVLAPGAGISGMNGLGGLFEGRGGQKRRDALKLKGGDAETEEAVARGLRWLAEHQEPAGCWAGRDHMDACRHAEPHCTLSGGMGTIGVTGLALLAFSGSGITHDDGGGTPWDGTVRRGVRWLLAAQTKDGRFPEDSFGGDYSHAIALQALCELYAMTQDPALRPACERGIRYLEAAQQESGGWDYSGARSLRGDVSLTGWAVLALRAARVAGFPVSESVRVRAGRFLQDATDPAQPWVAYVTLNGVRDGGTLATQAAGLYSLRNLGAIGEGLDAALVRTLADNPPLFSRRAPGDASDYGRTIYSVYYSGLCLVTSPDNIWRPWNDAMKRELLALQCRSGGADGSWPPIGRDAEQAGRQYMTAMAVLSLEVYYRFTPSLKAGADPLRVSSPKPEPVTDVTEPSELAVLLRSQDMRVRREAAREICRRKDASALPALLAAIRAERTSAKRLMVQDLTAFGDRPELPGELVALLDDDGVRDVVMKVLSTVTGETHATAEAWTAWWATQKR